MEEGLLTSYLLTVCLPCADLVLTMYLLCTYYVLTMTYSLWRAAQEKPRPRRLTFVMDVSGSMYRFNGHDGRLNKVIRSLRYTRTTRVAPSSATSLTPYRCCSGW